MARRARARQRHRKRGGHLLRFGGGAGERIGIAAVTQIIPSRQRSTRHRSNQAVREGSAEKRKSGRQRNVGKKKRNRMKKRKESRKSVLQNEKPARRLARRNERGASGAGSVEVRLKLKGATKKREIERRRETGSVTRGGRLSSNEQPNSKIPGKCLERTQASRRG